MICFMSNHGNVDGGDLKYEKGEKKRKAIVGLVSQLWDYAPTHYHTSLQWRLSSFCRFFSLPISLSLLSNPNPNINLTLNPNPDPNINLTLNPNPNNDHNQSVTKFSILFIFLLTLLPPFFLHRLYVPPDIYANLIIHFSS